MYFTSPKNFKRGKLIGNRYRAIDLLIAFSSIAVSIVSEIVYLTNYGTNPVIITLLAVPIFFSTLLLIPSGIYHNVLTYIHLFIINNHRRRFWNWEGIYHHEIKD